MNAFKCLALLLVALVLHHGVAGLRMQRPRPQRLAPQAYEKYSGTIEPPAYPTEGELAARTTAPNVISWLDKAAHGHVIEALTAAGAKLKDHGHSHLHHWEF